MLNLVSHEVVQSTWKLTDPKTSTWYSSIDPTKRGVCCFILILRNVSAWPVDIVTHRQIKCHTCPSNKLYHFPTDHDQWWATHKTVRGSNIRRDYGSGSYLTNKCYLFNKTYDEKTSFIWSNLQCKNRKKIYLILIVWKFEE